MTPLLLHALRAHRAARRPCAVVTDLDTGAQTLVLADRQEAGDLVLAAGDLAQVRAMLGGEASALIDSARPLFADIHPPPRRLVIVGAVHIAQHLAPMAAATGYEVVLIDPRAVFASAERFGAASILSDWPDEALAAIGLDAATAVVTLTHDPKLDDPALRLALPSPAFYVGALGSRKTHAGRVERLRAAGLEDAVIDRLHAPIGLTIQARSPAEIAVAILAELIAVRRGASP